MSKLTERLEAARIAKAAEGGDWSNREIARKVGISSPTVDRMFNGQGKTKVKNLDAVAGLLGIPIREARELAQRPAGDSGPYEGPEESELLNSRQRKALDELIRSIVQAASLDDSQPGNDITAAAGRAAQRMRPKQPKHGSNEGA